MDVPLRDRELRVAGLCLNVRVRITDRRIHRQRRVTQQHSGQALPPVGQIRLVGGRREVRWCERPASGAASATFPAGGMVVGERASNVVGHASGTKPGTGSTFAQESARTRRRAAHRRPRKKRLPPRLRLRHPRRSVSRACRAHRGILTSESDAMTFPGRNATTRRSGSRRAVRKRCAWNANRQRAYSPGTTEAGRCPGFSPPAHPSIPHVERSGLLLGPDETGGRNLGPCAILSIR